MIHGFLGQITRVGFSMVPGGDLAVKAYDYVTGAGDESPVGTPGIVPGTTGYSGGGGILGGLGTVAKDAAVDALRMKFDANLSLQSGGLPGMPSLPVGSGTSSGSKLSLGSTSRGFVNPAQNQVLSNTLPMSLGTVLIRPPRGYVTVNTVNGRMFMLRSMAISQRLWKAPKKPPISVRDWNCILGANRVVKKLKSIESKVKRVANFRAPVRRPLIAPHPHTVKIPANVK